MRKKFEIRASISRGQRAGAIPRGKCNKMAVVFTHFLTQKSIHLSTYLLCFETYVVS